jgi:hypothetical protein
MFMANHSRKFPVDFRQFNKLGFVWIQANAIEFTVELVLK